MSIRVNHLTYTYRTRSQPALDDVSAEFQPGQVTLIAGASGSGKTTLIRCINGLIPHSYANGNLRGQVTIFGQDNRGMSLAEISQEVGTVLQDPEQQIIASQVLGEIAFGLENLGLERNEIIKRVHQTAELLHISHLLQRETFTLSGGEKQKVALAGVLAMRPKALLLDEPLALLDPAAGQEALAMLRDLADTGIALIIIEHRIEEVMAMHPERCLYLNQGRIVYAGDSHGMLQSVDWREMKLPAPVIIQRVRAEGGQRTNESIDAPPIRDQPSQATQPLLDFQHVHFQYRIGPEVLHDVSFAIRKGDRIAILGPNGAGKTTLAKHIIGLHKPTQGQVLLQGQDSKLMSVAQIAHTIGYVFQSPSHMLFARTVHEELSFGPNNLGMDDAAVATNIAHALNTVNLPGTEDIAPLAMSFGQQKRISIASILSMNPRVLVMDEPSAGQDYASYTHFMDDIVGAGSDHSFDAVLFITHDLDLAITYANRILLVAEGELVADGMPQSVLQDSAVLERCHIRPTSLLEANLRALPKSGRFMPASLLAEYT
jgi:energy-coupling factor transport system ATP-binding protein